MAGDLRKILDPGPAPSPRAARWGGPGILILMVTLVEAVRLGRRIGQVGQ